MNKRLRRRQCPLPLPPILLRQHRHRIRQPKRLRPRWLRLPPRWGRFEFVSQVRRQGLALVPSDAFAVGEEAPPDAVRVSLGAASSREQLRAALRAIAAVFANDAFAPFSEVV